MTPSVRLLSHTPEPVRAMAVAARLCYTPATIEDVDKSLDDAACVKLVQKILSNRHHSVMEHAVFTFGVEGVSRSFLAQMTRHRNTSFEVQSQHYCVEREAEYDTPSTIPIGMTEELDLKARYHEHMRGAFRLYKDLVAAGMPKEDARQVLPNGWATKLVMTANLRQWIHFVTIRSCVVNCREIMLVAIKVKKLLQDMMPFLEQHLGPTCLTEGVCWEGRKYCGAPWGKYPLKVKGDRFDFVLHDVFDNNRLMLDLGKKDAP